MSIGLTAWWLGLLVLGLASRSLFLSFFVACQFVFVGIGLLVFPALGMDVVADLFASFELASIDASDFDTANRLVLVGCTVAMACALFVTALHGLTRAHASSVRQHSEVSPWGLHAGALLTILVGWGFIRENWAGFSFLLNAGAISDLVESFELRRGATGDYLTTLAIYNLLPAFTIVALLAFYEKRSAYRFGLFAVMCGITVVALLLTFQKRPLVIFVGFAFLAWMFMPMIGARDGRRFGISRLAGRGLVLLPVAFVALFFLYYFYTGIRFEASPLEAVGRITEIIVSRVAGRLALPAAMYVDYFPAEAPFYGLSNVGLVTALLGKPLFADSAVVFSAYSKTADEGSVAASLFIDAYGQAGVVAVVAYAVLIGVILAILDIAFEQSRTGASRVFLVISAFVFLYYLSQASLFRSLLGYGGAFYFMVWLVGFRVERTRRGIEPVLKRIAQAEQ